MNCVAIVVEFEFEIEIEVISCLSAVFFYIVLGSASDDMCVCSL